jgi:hypothetical protein
LDGRGRIVQKFAATGAPALDRPRSAPRLAAVAAIPIAPAQQPKPGRAAAGAFARAWNSNFHPTLRQVTVEQLLLWAYTAQRVVEITGRSLFAGEERGSWADETFRNSADGCVQIGRNAELGCTVDGGSPIRGIAQPLHPDAELVHDVVLAMPWHQAGMLIVFGRTGNAPQPPPAPRYRPVTEFLDGRFRTKITRRWDPECRCARRWCPVVLVPDPASCGAQARAVRLWEAAKSDFRSRLAEAPLRAHEVVD